MAENDHWIEYRCNLPTDPKVIRLEAILGIPRAHVIGACMMFWGFAEQHSAAGYFPDMGPEIIDGLVGVEGFGAALIRVGWVVERDGHIEIPEFDKHLGKRAAYLRRERERKRESRSRHHEAGCGADTARTSADTSELSAATGQDSTRQEEQREREISVLPAQSARSTKSGSLSRDLNSNGGRIVGASARYAVEADDVRAVLDAIPPNRRRRAAGLREAVRAALVLLGDDGISDPVAHLTEALSAWLDSDEAKSDTPRAVLTLLREEFWSEPREAWGGSAQSRAEEEEAQKRRIVEMLESDGGTV